jgi:hypothetical protein
VEVTAGSRREKVAVGQLPDRFGSPVVLRDVKKKKTLLKPPDPQPIMSRQGNMIAKIIEYSE